MATLKYQTNNSAIIKRPVTRQLTEYLKKLSYAAIVKVWYSSGVYVELECGEEIERGSFKVLENW